MTDIASSPSPSPSPAHAEATALIPLYTLCAAAIEGELEPWGLREGANQGKPETAGKLVVSGHGMSAGVWECTPGGWDTVDRHATEAMLFLSGRARITTKGAEPVIVQAGDSLVLPKGWHGRWEVLETVRKFFVEVK